MCPLFLWDFNENWIFSTDFQNISAIKFNQRVELFHADGQTDIYDEANSRFSQFCENAQKGVAFCNEI
jgi:hypothetical protein